jgi:hypothetical protein
VTEDLTDSIEESAKGPRQVTADGVTAQQHSLPDQIEADKYLAQKKAAGDPAKAFARAKIVPPETA